MSKYRLFLDLKAQEQAINWQILEQIKLQYHLVNTPEQADFFLSKSAPRINPCNLKNGNSSGFFKRESPLSTNQTRINL